MSASTNICLLCRHGLTAKVARQASQWRPKASYSTAPDAIPSNQTARIEDQHAPNPRRQVPAEGQEQLATKPNIRRVMTTERQSITGLPLSSPVPKKRRRNVDKKPKVDMGALFQQIVHREGSVGLAAEKSPQTRSFDQTLIQDIGRMQEMLDKHVPVAEIYMFFIEKIRPSVRQEGAFIPAVYHTVALRVMHDMIPTKKGDMWNPQLPSVAEIFQGCAELGNMKPMEWSREWIALVGELVRRLCEMKASPDDHTSLNEHLARRDAIVTDLVESWKILSVPKDMAVDVSTNENEVLDGFWLSRLDKYPVRRYANSGKFALAFSSLFPRYPLHHFADQLAVLAIASFVVLMDRSRSSTNARRSSSRFMSKLAYVIHFVGVDDNLLRKTVHRTYPSIETYIMGQWPRVTSYLHDMQSTMEQPDWQKPETKLHTIRSRKDGAPFSTLEKKISSAYGAANVEELNRLWKEFATIPKETAQEHAAKLRQAPHIFDSFINIFMELNKPDQAIEVWNTLAKVGLKPTLVTWNVMLDGCKKARNGSGLKTVWKRLTASGIQLDVAIWTTRIAGLMECDGPAAAIAALEEMADLWTTTPQHGDRKAVPLAIQPVNAVLQGLIRRNKTAAAHKLLAWAKANGIKPDVITFNQLLRPLIVDGHEKEVAAIFSSMQSAGVKADAATFTVVLDAALTKANARDPQLQVEVVKLVFREMDAAGLEANLHTYGKLITFLLRSGDHAQAAVKFVVDHLWDRGYEFSPHIYTMLIEHYFSRRPPDLDGVERLLKRRKEYDYDDMDWVLYDRIIQGYASARELDKAYATYQKLSSAGSLVSLQAQAELLKLLVQSQRGEEAQSMVQDTIQKYTKQHGSGGWRGHTFWYLAERAGLVDWVVDGDGGKAVLSQHTE